MERNRKNLIERLLGLSQKRKTMPITIPKPLEVRNKQIEMDQRLRNTTVASTFIIGQQMGSNSKIHAWQVNSYLFRT
jgi:hypothetical protein